MSSPYSIYSINQAATPKWLPGEELAATAFLAMTLLLALEINVQIHRVFIRRKGLYFWSVQIGSIACALDVLALVIRYLIPNTIRSWPFYTLIATVAWASYTLAQLGVLFSRIHLVLQNQKIQNIIFYAIVIISPILIVVDWIVIWPAFNPSTTQRWSAPAAIVERICQLGFSTLEVTINLTYAISVFKLLRNKPSVRQRRVMLDLIYVNVLAITFDILNIILVYVNRTGMSRPIQAFSYAMKLRLEFIVLNQLMAVAARGLRRESFGERRYHQPLGDGHDWQSRQTLKKSESGNTDGDIGQPSTNDSDSASCRGPTSLMDAHTPSHFKTTLRGFMPRSSGGRDVSESHEMKKGSRHGNGGWQEHDGHASDEEEVGLHMWERRGTRGLDVPWFQRATGV